MSDNKILRRQSIRLKGCDYTQAGGYFITVCSFNREKIFGDVVDGKMISSQFGEIVEEEWFRTSQIRPNINLDAFVIMPNHIHGIIMIYDTPARRGTLQRAPTPEQFGKPVSNSIPTIVRLFKSATTKRINEVRKTPKWPVWQRNYYEHIIRNENDLYRIRDYIICNPLNWDFDEENR